MITGELKNKIDGLWEIFWTGGLTNPLDVIEQMTYLMFIRDLDDADNLHIKESAMLAGILARNGIALVISGFIPYYIGAAGSFPGFGASPSW